MNLYYEDLFRTETDQDQIDTLLRKGWIECPPEPSYDPQTQAPPYWDTINHAWIVKYLTPEQIAELRNSEYPPVTPRQMRIWLQRQNITSADVELQITNMISNPEAREEAMIEWEYSVAIYRDNPLTVALANAFGYTQASLDAQWADITKI